MNALHLIPYHLAKLHVLCHEQPCLADSFLHDGHLACANHCISKCRLCLLFLHVYHSGDTFEYLDCAMSSTLSNYKSVHDNRFHGDEDFDPRSDLSQGRGDDAEHPTIIPMYTRAYAIGPKVNSLLSESSISACKTWMLLQARTLFILRYTRGDHGEPKDQGQACAKAKEGEGRRDSCYRPRTSGPSPDIRPDPRKSGAHHRRHPKLNQVSPDIRPVASRRTSGPAPGNPAPHHRSWTLPARTSGPSVRTFGVSGRPGHPARRPDIRPPLPVCSTSGPRPMYPFVP